MNEQILNSSIKAYGDNQQITIELPARLNFETVGTIWKESIAVLTQHKPQTLTLLASSVIDCDGSGIALLSKLESTQETNSGAYHIDGLQKHFRELLNITQTHKPQAREPAQLEKKALPIRVGHKTLKAESKLRQNITFFGEFFYQLARAFKTPKNVRWKDTFNFIEVIGPGAIPITALLGFLFGLILAFQAVIPLQTFGAEIYVIRLVGISLVRELAPLLASIIIISRTASAFAAELGTMKVNRELDALNTMGIESMRFLVLPRVIAVMAIMPGLTVFLALFSFIGAYIVSLSLGFGFHIFMNELYQSFDYIPIITSMVKAIVFGLLVAITGCYHGLNTDYGSTAVGQSTTKAVVAGIVVLTITDGVFSILIYILGV